MPETESLNINDWKQIMAAQQTAETALEKSKEAMDYVTTNNKPTNGELAIMIANLTGMIEQGFKGVHERQDRTNGRIGKAEDRLSKLENWRWYLIGGGSVILFCFGVAIKFIK